MAEVEKPRQPLLAMVALAKPVVPDREKLESFFEKAWPKGPSLEILEQEGDTISFGLSGERGKVALVNQPIPLAELEWPAQLAWHWPEAWKKLKKHQAHVLVALAGREEEDVSLVSRYLALTRVVAAVAATTKAIGVYWGDAPAVASTEMFVLAARHATEQLLPLQLWINFNVLFDENERKLALATFGLEAFDMPEVEAVCGKRKGPEVMEIVAGVVLYLLRNGPVIEDGDFVPGPSGEKIKVTFGPSARGARKVMRLQLG